MNTRGPRIRSKLAFAFTLQLALVAGVAAAGLLGLRTVRDSFQTAIDRGLEAQRLAGEIKAALYAARWADTEFLQRVQSDPVAAQEYVSRNRQHVARLNELIGELERHEATETVSYPPRQSAEDLVALKPYVNVYAEDFEKAVTLIGTRKSGSSQLDDSFREFAHELLLRLRNPAMLGSLVANLVELRRNERAFVMQGNISAVSQLRQSATRLAGQLVVLPPPQRQRIEKLLARYLEEFDKEVAVVAQIDKMVAAFQSNAAVVEPLVNDIAAMGRQEAQVAIRAAQSASNNTVWGVSAVLVVAMLTGVALAYALGHQITAPLSKLARTVEAIGAGDLSAQAQVKSRDEIGVLANTFNAMTSQVRGLVQSLEQRVREREQAEGEVRRLNAELEGRVKARTGELESANLELEAFTYSVSHDLRTPLRHIAGFVYLLHQHSPTLDQESLEHLAVIEASVKRMGALIDALLAFSRIGRAELSRVPVDLRALIEEARAELQNEIDGRDIVWRIGPLPELVADRVLLQQVVVNLISNAVKFTRPRARAEVEISEAPSRAGPDEVVFMVRDNGVGFDMNFTDKLFGVFKRLHLPEEFEGTGIGLANVERIVRRHGGRIWAEAELDKGATFYVALPGAAQAGKQAAG